MLTPTSTGARAALMLFSLLSLAPLIAADINDDLREAVKRGQRDRVISLLAQGADPTVSDRRGTSALGAAAVEKDK